MYCCYSALTGRKHRNQTPLLDFLVHTRYCSLFSITGCILFVCFAFNSINAMKFNFAFLAFQPINEFSVSQDVGSYSYNHKLTILKYIPTFLLNYYNQNTSLTVQRCFVSHRAQTVLKKNRIFCLRYDQRLETNELPLYFFSKYLNILWCSALSCGLQSTMWL